MYQLMVSVKGIGRWFSRRFVGVFLSWAPASLLFAVAFGGCAVPGRYYGDGLGPGPLACAVEGCGPGVGCGCTDRVASGRPGLFSGVFRVLGIGPVCGDCGPRYWGDWNGDPAKCENCDDYSNWTGDGQGYVGTVPGEITGGDPAVSDSSPCPHCRHSLAQEEGPRPDQQLMESQAEPSTKAPSAAVPARRASGASLSSGERRAAQSHEARVAVPVRR